MKGSGVMFRPLSARIRPVVFSALSGEVEAAERVRTGRGASALMRKEQEELLGRVREMMSECRWKLSNQASII